MYKVFSLILLLLLLVSVSGCTTTQKGMTFGALGGAVVGGAGNYFLGDETTDSAITGAAVGAATGAVVGGIIGYFSEE